MSNENRDVLIIDALLDQIQLLKTKIELLQDEKIDLTIQNSGLKLRVAVLEGNVESQKVTVVGGLGGGGNVVFNTSRVLSPSNIATTPVDVDAAVPRSNPIRYQPPEFPQTENPDSPYFGQPTYQGRLTDG